MTGGTVTILYARASIIIIISIFYIAGGAEHTSIYPGCTGNRRGAEEAFYALFPKYENRLDVLFFITERRLAPP